MTSRTGAMSSNVTFGLQCGALELPNDTSFLAGNTLTVLAMQVGFALLEAGCVPCKNKVRVTAAAARAPSGRHAHA